MFRRLRADLLGFRQAGVARVNIEVGDRKETGEGRLRNARQVQEPSAGVSGWIGYQSREEEGAQSPTETAAASSSALSVIRFAREHFTDLPQAVCFDTAFHAELPDVARVLPIPRNC
jgi:hypothetical protein